MIKTNFLGDEIPKENMHYTSIACITIDSVMRMEKRDYPQVHLEECKYKSEKVKMTKFINTELESVSEAELESDTELESKLNLILNSCNFFFRWLLLVAYYFGQVKKILVTLLTLDKLNKILFILRFYNLETFLRCGDFYCSLQCGDFSTMWRLLLQFTV